ncbi:MAG TPA: hypothetical protein VII58_02395, partial [Acidobacteriaceae bacterium]
MRGTTWAAKKTKAYTEILKRKVALQKDEPKTNAGVPRLARRASLEMTASFPTHILKGNPSFRDGAAKGWAT